MSVSVCLFRLLHCSRVNKFIRLPISLLLVGSKNSYEEHRFAIIIPNAGTSPIFVSVEPTYFKICARRQRQSQRPGPRHTHTHTYSHTTHAKMAKSGIATAKVNKSRFPLFPFSAEVRRSEW